MGEIKNDFIYFKNEVLEDINNLERKLNSKILSIAKNMEIITQNSENQSQLITTKFAEISNYIQERTTFNELKIELQKLTKKTNTQNTIYSTKINSLEKDLSDTCFKYEKMILNNIMIPGLIGDKCKFKTLKDLISFIYQSIKDFVSDIDKKTKEIIEMKIKINNMSTKLNEYLITIKKETNDIILTNLQEFDKKFVKENIDINEKLDDIKTENDNRYLELKEKLENIQKTVNKNDENSDLKNEVKDKNNIGNKNENNSEIQKMKKKINELNTIINDIKTNINEIKKSKNDKKMYDKIQIKKNNEDNSINSLNISKVENIIKTYIIKNNLEIREKEKPKLNNFINNKNTFRREQYEKKANEHINNKNNKIETIPRKLLTDGDLLKTNNKENNRNLGSIVSNMKNNIIEENSDEKLSKTHREKLPSITMNDKLDLNNRNENLSRNNFNINIIRSPKSDKFNKTEEAKNNLSFNILDNKINKFNEELSQFKTILSQIINKLNKNNVDNNGNNEKYNKIEINNYTDKKIRTFKLSNKKESNNNCLTDKKQKKSIQYVINLQKEIERKVSVNERNKSSDLFRYINNSENTKTFNCRTLCEDNKNIVNQNNVINSSYIKPTNIEILKKIEPYLIKQFRK